MRSSTHQDKMCSREAGGEQERTDTLYTHSVSEISVREGNSGSVCETHIWVLQIQWEIECIAWEQKKRIALNYSKGHLD